MADLSQQLNRTRSSHKTTQKIVDLHALNYIDPVDDNLLCPICAIPLVEPVTTPCDHTFCRGCLKRSCKESSTCPVDRETISLSRCPPTSRLIKNQLDSLMVECPNAERGCSLVLKREVVVSHVEHRCPFALVPCPDESCEKKVVRKDSEKACQHREEACRYCGEPLELADMEKHLEEACAVNTTSCEACGEEIAYSKMKSHEDDCQEAETACEFAEFGCQVVAKRKDLQPHRQECQFQILSVVGRQVANQREHIAALEQDRKVQAQKITDLERIIKTFVRGDRQSVADLMGMSPAAMMVGVSDADGSMPPDGPLFSAYNSLERQLEELSKNVTDLETRQTVMVLNQVMPIKDQITELRSTLGILKMHVAWLMNSRREELERTRLASRTAAAAASAATAGGGGGGAGRGSSDGEVQGLAMPRRLSDGSDAPRL